MADAAREWTPVEKAWMRLATENAPPADFKLFRVEVERKHMGEAQILARTQEEAEESASEMASDIVDGAFPEDDTYATEITVEQADTKEYVWVPEPGQHPDRYDPGKGEWIPFREWQEKTPLSEVLVPLKGQTRLQHQTTEEGR